mgnify:CR=1 FL=1
MIKHSIGVIILKSLALVVAVLGIIFFYVLVHEGGHALVALLFGGKIASFKVNFFVHSPSVSYVGIIEPMQHAMISLGGPLLPLFFALPLTFLVRKARHVLSKGILLLALGSVLPTLLISTVVALFSGFGKIIPNEDVAKFILFSGIHPFIVATAFLLLFVFTLLFLVKVGKVKNIYSEVLKELRGPRAFAHSVMVRIIVVVCLLASGGLIFWPERNTEQVHKSFKYETRIHVDFDQLPSNSVRFYEFTLEEPTTYDFVYSLQTDSEVILRLVNASGGILPFNNHDSIVIYQGNENLGQAYFTGFTLPEGDYALEILAGGNGFLTMYIDTRVPGALEQKYLSILSEVNKGTFTATTYQEKGYQLIYAGELVEGNDQILKTIPAANYERAISAFLVGDYEQMSLSYVADGKTRTLLDGFQATMGYGLPAHKGRGEFRVTVVNPSAKLYIYIKK